jgi:hypothetical protein
MYTDLSNIIRKSLLLFSNLLPTIASTLILQLHFTTFFIYTVSTFSTVSTVQDSLRPPFSGQVSLFTCSTPLPVGLTMEQQLFDTCLQNLLGCSAIATTATDQATPETVAPATTTAPPQQLNTKVTLTYFYIFL